MICSRCKNKIFNVTREQVPEKEWDTWTCSECDGEFYGQLFINWVANRISPSTSEDTTGRFVLRELVQNADDVESDIIIFRFCDDALYVYNNGFGFRTRKDGPSDFERISTVLAKPKENEFYTSGNFGSGFQTVYLFTNYPEIHSHGKSVRYDPTVPIKKEIIDGKLKSPYDNNDEKKGVIFRFPWRTEENAIVENKKGHKFFENRNLWKRWDLKSRELLYEQLKEYLHDSLLCCQHLNEIRILWDAENLKKGYQVERDFKLNYIDNNGRVGTVVEGEGEGGVLLEEWNYKNHKTFQYLIGSGFVHDINKDKPSIYLITENDEKKEELDVKLFIISDFNVDVFSYQQYNYFLEKNKARKKSDVHVLIPIFPWEERAINYVRKAWSYSVIPLPKESGNNFTVSAHLFPKETREAFEIHQEKAKMEWLQKVLVSVADLYLNTYSKFVEHVKESKFNDATKQKILLDYLPETKLGNWVNVSLDDNRIEEKMEENFFIKVLSEKILLYKNQWISPFKYSSEKSGINTLIEQVTYPRNDTERWLLEKMNVGCFTKEFVEHHRFKELKAFISNIEKRMQTTDEKFVTHFKEFSRELEGSGVFFYKSTYIDKNFVSTLINHCLINNRTDVMRSIPIIPNKLGKMCVPNDLRKEPNGNYSILSMILPSYIYPHPDFTSDVKEYLNEFDEPLDLLKGMEENKLILENNLQLLIKCYEWLDASKKILPLELQNYPIFLDCSGALVTNNNLFWLPNDHHKIICKLLTSVGCKVKIFSQVIFLSFSDFVVKKLKLNMLDYSLLAKDYPYFFEGTDLETKKLQATIVEGILLGLENKTHLTKDDKELFSNLRFLPIGGKLHPPQVTCIGSVNDSDINFFVKSIDKHVQDVIMRKESFIKILKELGMGNLKEDPVNWIVDTIERFANDLEESNGIASLDKTNHRLISKCLELIINKPGFSQNKSIMSKRIIPVKYHDGIILSTLPRWDIKYGDMRAENYERDWPWESPKSEHLDVKAKILWNEIKFIHLGEGFEKIQDSLIKQFSIKQLIDAKGGVPRNLVMHFLAPRDSEKSLFIDKNINQFIKKTSSTSEIRDLKKIFLYYVCIYYESGEHKGEKVDIKSAPCLYDLEGNWRCPTDFAFKINEDIESIGYHQLSPDLIDGYDRQTLKNMGVVDRVEFSKIESFLKNLCKYPEDQKNARTVLKIILLAMSEKIGSSDDWKDLSEITWIPTLDGKWRKPKDVLPHLPEITNIVDSSYTLSLIDISSLKEEERDLISRFDLSEFTHLGFRKEPTYEEMIDVWKSCQNLETKPPSKLFDKLETEFENWSKNYRIAKINLKYYCNNKWVNPKIVVMNEKSSIPEPLTRKFVFSDKHERIIKWLRDEIHSGEKPRIKAQEALSIVETLNIDEIEQIWNYIVSYRNDLGSRYNVYKDKSIVPIDGKLFSPSNIIIPDNSELAISLRGEVGTRYIIDETMPPEEKNLLLRLGANRFSDISKNRNELENLLTVLVNINHVTGTEQWENLVHLLNYLKNPSINYHYTIEFIPIRKNGFIVFKKPKDVLIVENYELGEIFKDENRLYLFDTTIFDNNEMDASSFLKWIEKCGSTKLESLVTINEPNGHNAEKNNYMTKKLINAVEILKGSALELFEPEDQKKISSKIIELEGSCIYVCEDISRSYSLNMDTIDGGDLIIKRIKNQPYYNRSQKSFFIHFSDNNNMGIIKEIILDEFNPDFNDRYRKDYWKKAIDVAFEENSDFEPNPHFYDNCGFVRRSFPDLQDNLKKMDIWWREYCNSEDNTSFPTLDGDFWWSALGLGNVSVLERKRLIKKGLLSDKKLMFNIFCMATMLGSNVNRNQIQNYLKILDHRGLSFSQIYDMGEEEVIKELITHALSSDYSTLQEKHYPEIRRRILDILIIRRALRDNTIGGNLLEMLKTHMEDGISPEEFLTTGHGYDNQPFMKGFKGMFTGQIYFIVREAVRLGLADKWSEIAFHAPTQVRTLIDNIGGEVIPPSSPSGREKMAKYMIEKISSHETLRNWYDVPFFIYYDEYCRNCTNGRIPGKECPLICYRKR